MSDKYACRLHPNGRCGARWKEDIRETTCAGAEFANVKQLNADTCPWYKSRMCDAPKQRTNLEVAKDIWKIDDIEGGVIIKIIRALGLDPDAPCKES